LSTKKIEPAPEVAGETVFEHMHEIMFLFRSQLQQHLREDGGEIPGMALKVLGFFARHPGCTQMELVQHSGRDKGQVARLVKDLTERGLLQRGDAAKGRRRGLQLTETGLGTASPLAAPKVAARQQTHRGIEHSRNWLS
jgi:DNA-binding MarR family transcriptional regulator